MSKGLSESAIVREVAKRTARRITRKVIAALQLITVKLSDDDTDLETAWDEICLQVQRKKSDYWDAYDETVRGMVDDQIAGVPEHEQDAMWLKTDAGIVWSCKEPDYRDEFPVCGDDIVEWLTAEYVYAEAESWSNARVRAYIERSSARGCKGTSVVRGGGNSSSQKLRQEIARTAALKFTRMTQILES